MATGLSCTALDRAEAHDWYRGLASPRGERCCDRRDCAAVAHRYQPKVGRLEIEVEGRWLPVDQAAVVDVSSPDGEVHACYQRLSVFGVEVLYVRCVIVPGKA